MDDRLRVFLTVSECRSFSKAAERLPMSQPAVTQCIKSIERDLDVQLFDRSHRTVRLTRAGDIVLAYAEQMDRLDRQMRSVLQEMTTGISGLFSVGASFTYGEYVLPRVLAAFRLKHAEVLPSVTIGNSQKVEQLLHDGKLDLGIIEADPKLAGLAQYTLFSDRLYVVRSGELDQSRERGHKAHALPEETWLVREAGSGTRQVFDAWQSESLVTPHRLIELGSTQAIKEGVAAGLGIAILSELSIQDELRQGTFRIADVKGFPRVRNFTMLSAENTFEPMVVKAYRDFTMAWGHPVIHALHETSDKEGEV
ncbi:LysR family transcriptional regulator [Ferroacidibacillus organovorans]|uniref:HTH lysR-type domain-containing protein n=1 Tax=Ferroacidibacillus organovorans TaxID=1765683 RepID=A0A853KIJ0_9BACL|nr:LysR family transcriptional regulator [Ferroacidibacillus organovorans]KYP81393.1 hypothetical protein AYJ22_01110 [Ferroacidibacillus organovorans]OAG95180.1 hypothetical protein AYW79_01710 [Ferroacidibacillus organovorans]